MAPTRHLSSRRTQTATDLLWIAMNKLLNKKKAPEATNESGYGPKSPPLPLLDTKKSTSSRWKKNKKQPEPLPGLAFELSLPSTDDFRTSLLMPNLSARFSMLREQDDPASLLGKASDDSVLAPRRRSRLGDFGFNPNGLNDIAEIQSIKSSIRPPFAAHEGQSAYGSEDGYGSENESTTNGSVMGRARRGEGNNLFGGRQKVYRIPTTGANSSKSGKPVYEDDVGKSAFQRYRQKERDDRVGRPSEESSGFDFGLDHSELYEHDDQNVHTPNDSAKDLSHSPSFSAYDKKRSTTSSMARSEARSSTAATSIASQPAVTSSSPLAAPSQIVPGPTAPAFKNRRLYEQGLDQHLHEQQTSAITRLNSMQRQRTIAPGKQSPPNLASPQKVTRNLSDRVPQAPYSTSGPQSPIRAGFATARQPSLRSASAASSSYQHPSSPTAVEFDENSVLNGAIEPGDRGKATALGAFDKPRHQFDENQYLERQHQLQRSQSKAGQANGVSALQQRMGNYEPANRQRSNSDISTRSRSHSMPKKYEPSKAYNLYQSAANQMPANAGAQGFERPAQGNFGDRNASEGEEEEADGQTLNGLPGFNARGWQPNALPSVSEHPALRGQKPAANMVRKDQEPTTSYMRTVSAESSLPAQINVPKLPVTNEAVDSPTLGSATGPLNGMMQHLRSGSNVSSIYPNDNGGLEDSPARVPNAAWAPRDLDMHNHPVRTTLDLDYGSSNPWDLSDLDSPYLGTAATRPAVSPIDEAHAQQSLPPPPANRDYNDVSPESEVSAMPWEDGSRKQHARDTSTATQQEREAFANELAARRTAIQENMKHMAERESHSRGVSPARSANSAFKSFGLKSKPSRESIVPKRDLAHDPMPPLRAKIFGGGVSANGSNIDLHHENSGSSTNTRSRDSSATRMNLNRPRNDSGARAPISAVQTRTLQSSEWERTRPRGNSDSSYTEHRQMASRRSPANSQGPRSRSNSSTTGPGGRSRSRTGPYRDDLQRAMAEGTGSSAAVTS